MFAGRHRDPLEPTIELRVVDGLTVQAPGTTPKPVDRRHVGRELPSTDVDEQQPVVCDKPYPLDGPYFAETLFVIPSRLPPELQAAALNATRKACRALGLVTGPIHAELRVYETGPWLIELAARSIGGRCSRALSFADGISLEELIIRHALGLPATRAKPTYKASGVMMIPIPGAGILHAVHGVEAARSTPGVTELVIEPLLGERLVPLPEGDRYLGFIFARGQTFEAVEAALRFAHAELRFELEETRYAAS